MQRGWHVVYENQSGQIKLLCSGDAQHYLEHVVKPALEKHVTWDCIEITHDVSQIETAPSHIVLKTFIQNFKVNTKTKKLALRTE